MRVENRSVYQHWRLSDGLYTITSGVIEIREVDSTVASYAEPDSVRRVLALETAGQYFGDEPITLVSKLYVSILFHPHTCA